MSDLQAATRRQGEYASPSAGQISMNGQLAEPIMDSVVLAWDALFGSRLAEHMRWVGGRAGT